MTEKLFTARLLSVMVPYSVDVMADGLVQENAAGVVVMVLVVLVAVEVVMVTAAAGKAAWGMWYNT